MRATFLSEEGLCSAARSFNAVLPLRYLPEGALCTAARSGFGGASPCPTISDSDLLCSDKNLPCPQAFQLTKANFTNSSGIHFKNPNRDSFHREASLRSHARRHFTCRRQISRIPQEFISRIPIGIHFIAKPRFAASQL